MTTKILSTTILNLALATSLFAQTDKKAPVHIGLVYPISTNGVNAHEYTNGVSFHAIAGVSKSEQAFAASGVANVILEEASGVAVAGFTNFIKGSADGGQFAGFLNYIHGNATGVQGAGFMNISGEAKGVQLAGWGNINKANVDGVQAAGFMNIAQNVNAQAAGFMNIASDVDGVQVAGYINKAKDVNTQVSGFLNIARKVKGVQISGFMNIAEESDYPIGLINIVKNGDKALGLTIDESLNSLIAFRSGGRVLYGIVGAGLNFNTPSYYDHPYYAMEAGIGAHINFLKNFRLNLEATTTSVTDFEDEINFKSSLRVLPTLRIAYKMEVFAGPSINFSEYYVGEGTSLFDHYIWSDTYNNYFFGLHFGGIAGIQYNF